MRWESWLKIALPAFPVGFTLLGLGLYWKENILPLLPPNIAFWGVVIAFYLFTHLFVPETTATFYLTAWTAALWLVASITSHNLAVFIASPDYGGFFRVFLELDFWFAYGFALLGVFPALRLFVINEPLIARETQRQREQKRQARARGDGET